jgi:uncharacterized membrane protein
MSANLSRKQLASFLSLITLISLLAAGAAMVLTNSLGYIPYLSFTYVTVYLISRVIASEEYTSYFKKYSSIYRVILVTAFVSLIAAVIARPTYYLLTTLIGLTGFDCILALLMLIIRDQNKYKQKPVESSFGT